MGKQLVRSADSVAANLSEGFGRFFYKENRRFCYFSRGSLYETFTWIEKAHNRGLISEHVETVANDSWLGEPIEGNKFYALADHVTNQALALLDRSQGQRQFFWFHYFDPHPPYGKHASRRVSLPWLRELATRDDPSRRGPRAGRTRRGHPRRGR